MITTAYDSWKDLLEIMTKEKPSQCQPSVAVVFDKDEQEWHYSRAAKFVAV